MKRKLLRIASYLSIATTGWVGGILFSAEVNAWVFFALSISAGTLLTATSILFMAEERRAMNEANALELRCRIMDRWCEMLIIEQIRGRMRDGPVDLRGGARH